MPANIIIVVTDRENPKRGEVTILDDARKAEHLVETLLEAGFEQERIRLYNGAAAGIEVQSRPVVALVDGAPRPTATSLRELMPEAADEPAPAAEPERQPEEAIPFVKDGVRFSSLFRAS
jgi:hypothetical protein